MRRAIFGVVCWLGASLCVAAQDSGLGPEQEKLLSLENQRSRAEQDKDAKALDLLLDNSLSYVDQHGQVSNKATYLAKVRARERGQDEQVTESMNAYMYGDSAVVNGVYRVKGPDKGKPHFRRGRFTDTWTNRKGAWMCVASQYTLISK